MYREDPVLVVALLVSNPGLRDVGAPEYDVSGLDGDGEDYPACPHDEPAFAPGASSEVKLTFPLSDDDCDRLATVVVRQFYDGSWTEVARLPSGFPDPCH